MFKCMSALSNLELDFHRLQQSCGKVMFLHLYVILFVKGVTTSTSYEYELRVSENKVQLMRIRDENGKFRSNSVSILNVTFA